MRVYEIEAGCAYKYTVVAESMGKAIELWEEEHKEEPLGIKLFSEYAIIQEAED